MLNGKTRLIRREVEGSQTFPFIEDSGITAGKFWRVDLTKDGEEYRKYAPFNSIVVQNNSAEILSLWLRGKLITYISAGSIYSFDEIWFSEFVIKNEDSTNSTSANEIIVTVQRMPLTTHMALRKKLGFLFA